jgi:ATP adenylyltransferase/5',5'''-P-1,P-4-tetraphosphate phosphorylase II
LDKKPGLAVNPPPLVTGLNDTLKAPASDINVQGFEIEVLSGATHILAFNKFAAYRPSLMILTLDASHQQTESLDNDDLSAAWSALRSLKRRYLGFYNCGRVGGCSRLHKHMQLVPAPDGARLWPDMVEDERPSLPFVYFETKLGEEATARTVLEAYNVMLAKTRDVLQRPEGHVPHNIIMTKDWLVVIPRRNAAYDGVAANAICMVGLVPLSDGEDKWYERWVRGAGTGPVDIVEYCGVNVNSLDESR